MYYKCCPIVLFSLLQRGFRTLGGIFLNLICVFNLLKMFLESKYHTNIWGEGCLFFAYYSCLFSLIFAAFLVWFLNIKKNGIRISTTGSFGQTPPSEWTAGSQKSTFFATFPNINQTYWNWRGVKKCKKKKKKKKKNIELNYSRTRGPAGQAVLVGNKS